MPPGTVKVDRSTKWGNPFLVSVMGRDAAVAEFTIWLQTDPEGQHLLARAKRELRGKNLACWCPLNEPCHAEILLEIVNQ